MTHVKPLEEDTRYGGRMSYCETLGFTKDGIKYLTEYRNAHGWSAYIWTRLHEKYIVHGSWIFAPQMVWNLVKDDQLTDEEKVTLWSTFDHSLVQISEIPALIRAYKAFLQLYPPEDKWVCHLPAMIDELQSIHDSPEDIIAVGWYGMSVGDNPWSKYNSEKKEYENYDVTTGTKHEFLGSFLEECCPKYLLRGKTPEETDIEYDKEELERALRIIHRRMGGSASDDLPIETTLDFIHAKLGLTEKYDADTYLDRQVEILRADLRRAEKRIEDLLKGRAPEEENDGRG